MSAFTGIGMEKQSALALTASRAVAAFLTTAVGIIVALAAGCLAHYLRSFSELLVKVSRSKFPLRRRFSEFPAFALIAAPALGLPIAAFMVFSSLQGSMGLEVALASSPCLSRGNERFVILHVTDHGKIFINGRPEDSNRLAERLSEIYESRSHPTMYFSADNAAAFQTVADAIDVATNAVDMRTAKPLRITLGLLTPAVLTSPCSEVH